MPQYNCSWHGIPDDVSDQELFGSYTSSASPDQSLQLNADGTYVTTGFAYGDWLSDYELRFDGDGRWHDMVNHGLGVPFVDVPFIGDKSRVEGIMLEGDGRGPAELSLGGTRAHAVLYLPEALDKDTCDSYSSLFLKR